MGIIAAISNKYCWALWSGLFLTTLGCDLLALHGTSTTTPQWIFLMLVYRFRIGLLFPPMGLCPSFSSAETYCCSCNTIRVFFQSLGQAIRVSVGGIILQNRFQIETKAFKDLSEITERNALNEISLVQVMKGLPSPIYTQFT